MLRTLTFLSALTLTLPMLGSVHADEVGAACEYGKPRSCPPELICVINPAQKGQCVPRYLGPKPLIRFPFEPKQRVVCTQGPQTPLSRANSSDLHQHLHDIFAIDLTTAPPKLLSGPSLPGKVFAALDGIALAYPGCLEGKSKPDCGRGLGNHVRLFSKEGIMVYYGNLASVAIEDGAQVKEGQLLGVEGMTGAVQSRRLHFSVHTFTPEKSEKYDLNLIPTQYRRKLGARPPAIPFELQYCNPDNQEECVRTRTVMSEVPCDPKDPKVIRADWRN